MIAQRKPMERSGSNVRSGDLIRAAYSGDLMKFRALLRDGADINEIEEKTGFTSLHIACSLGNSHLVAEILEFDNSTNLVDFEIRCLHRPRLAWQLAMNAHFYNVARSVDAAGLHKRKNFEPN